MYRKLLSILMLICIPLVSGCWDIEEINNRAVLSALYVDVGNPKKVKFGASFNMPGTLVPPTVGSSNATSRYYTTFAEGDGILEAWTNLQANAARSVFFGQLDTVILSDKIARRNINDVLDFFGRIEPVPNDIHVLVTKSNPQKLFEMKNQANFIMGNYIKSYFQAKDKKGLGLPSFQWQVLEMADNGVSDPYVPIIGSSQNMYQITGTALFSQKRMVGELNLDETQTLSWLKGISDSYLNVPDGGNGLVAYSEVNSKTKIVPEINNKGVLTINITTAISGSIYETNPSKIGMTRKEQKNFERITEDYTKKRIEGLLSKLQKLDSDPVGFGEKVRIKYPRQWEKTDWYKVYPNARINVKTSFAVNHSGLFR